MVNKNDLMVFEDDVLNLEEAEELLAQQLEDSFKDLELLENDKEVLKNPENLGKVILDEVWKQFGNQIGLDITNETLIQKYDREHPEAYSDIKDSVLQDPAYREANKEMADQQKVGTLKDTYTGKDLKAGDKANLDHVVPRKELYENQRRKQANMGVSELANKKENLKPTNESLNKSKGAKSNQEYIEKREEREADLIKQNERANKKIDESSLSNAEKRAKKAENNKRLNDKLAAADELMKQADKEARKAINRDIRKNAAKEAGKKAGKDALKTMAVSALFALSKDIMNGLIRFLKLKSKSFKIFLEEMKQSLKSFFSKITSFLKTGASTFISTIISEIFGPIVSMFKKLASLIKQGVSSLMEAIHYLRDKNNRNKLLSVKVAHVGKIITAALTGGSAIFLGEVFEKFLLTVPGFQTPIPLMGTLANIIGLFLSSLVSGVMGAIILNLIDKFISKKLDAQQAQAVINQNNQILNIQDVQVAVAEENAMRVKENAMKDIFETNAYANNTIEKSLHNIFKKDVTDVAEQRPVIDETQARLLKLQKELEDLL